MTAQRSKLLVVWSTDNKVTALHLVFMYTVNSRLKKWWDDVVLLIWGASSLLSAHDSEVRDRIAQAREAGVRVIACKGCAEKLGVVEDLETLGVEVFYVGEFLSEWLKSGDALLTF